MTDELKFRERMALRILRVMFMIVAPDRYAHKNQEMMNEIFGELDQ